MFMVVVHPNFVFNMNILVLMISLKLEAKSGHACLHLPVLLDVIEVHITTNESVMRELE